MVSQNKNGKKKTKYLTKVMTFGLVSILLLVAIIFIQLLVSHGFSFPYNRRFWILLYLVWVIGFVIGIVLFIGRNRSQFHAFFTDQNEIYWAVFYNPSRGFGPLAGMAMNGIERAIENAQRVKKLKTATSIYKEEYVYLYHIVKVNSITEVSFAYKVDCLLRKRKNMPKNGKPMEYGKEKRKTVLVLKDIENVDGLVDELQSYIS